MKRIALAAALALATTLAGAQSTEAPKPPDIPKPKCEPKPEFPGRVATDNQRRNFDRTYKAWDACMKAYLEERKAGMKAHENAANAAIEEYNTLVKNLQAEQAK